MELNFASKSMFILKVPQKPSVFTCDIWFATPFTSIKFKGRDPKLVLRSRSDYFSEGEVVQPFGHKTIEMKSWMQVLPSKLDLLDPSSLGICPDPPDWPERDEVCRISIEQKAKFFGIPHSLRMIKRKQIWRDGFADAGEFAYCSVKKAFSSLVLIIRELQSYTLSLREGLNYEDLVDVVNKMQRDMTLTFVWLFRQVFSTTPTLMVYVMLLLANYSLHSMSNKAFIDVTQQEVRLVENVMLLAEEETDGELGLWRSMVEEASRMRGYVYHNVIDHQIRQQLVSPLSVILEYDNDEEIMHARMDLVYQMRIAEEPDNPLFLSNYAQFLSLVVKDHDRAEECFKRAIEIEPQDVKALEQYAEFLWKVRNDLPEAEERYIQAMAADQDNPFSVSKYAYFLWTTGNEGTCYPLKE